MTLKIFNTVMELQSDNEDIEVHLLMEAIFQKYGYDFRRYARASQKRQVLEIMRKNNFNNIPEFQFHLLRDESLFVQVLNDLTITFTEFFRDPSFYQSIREKIVPYLKTFSQIKIWGAGCATGAEAYSLSILLTEEGLYDRCLIYATDINPQALKKAKAGVFPNRMIKQMSKNYFASGGKESLSNYLHSKYDYAKIDESLKKNLVFSEHNLATDQPFGEMNLIVCRNVIIYFNHDLQERVIRLFSDSLHRGGFLALGSKESLGFNEVANEFEKFVPQEQIFRKKQLNPSSQLGET